MKKVLLLLGTCCAIMLISCKYDVEEELDGLAKPCDTTNVTYSVTMIGIINTYGCLTCHSGPTPIASFRLDSYEGMKAKVDDGRLIGAINHWAGYTAMPQDRPKMNECDIQKVEAWVNAGAPNN